MEKLKSRNALSNFLTTAPATAGIFVLKIEWARASIKNIPQGLKPNLPGANCGTTEVVP